VVLEGEDACLVSAGGDAPGAPAGGVPGGVPGGTPGGVPGGVPGGAAVDGGRSAAAARAHRNHLATLDYNLQQVRAAVGGGYTPPKQTPDSP